MLLRLWLRERKTTLRGHAPLLAPFCCAVLLSTGTNAQDNAAKPPSPAAVLAYYPGGATTELGRRIATLLAAPGARRAHWGIAVTTLEGTPVYGLDEGKLFRPASTAKLFTTAAALAVLGPGKRFATTVIAEGPMEAGRLRGNLVLKGGGDANFGSHNLPYRSPAPDAHAPAPGKLEQLTDMETLADQIVATGLKTVDGDVIGDDTYFEDTPYAEGWAIEDMLWGYGAPVSALTIHDNQLDLTLTPPADPKANLQQLPVVLSPDLPYYTVNPEQPEKGWTTASGWAGGVYSQDFGRNQVAIERTPGSRTLAVVGDVATAHGPVHEQIAIEEPARYAALALRAALEKRGVLMAGATTVRHYDSGFVGSFLQTTTAPPAGLMNTDPKLFFSPDLRVGCEANRTAQGADTPSQALAEHTSDTFAEDLRFTLKESQNLHAEIMLRNVAAARDCEHTLRRGVQLLRAYLLYAGLSGEDFVFYDGSGLSAKDLVTPRAEAQLLAYAARQPWFAAWKAALPVGGVDGTLEHRFTEPPLKGHVFAKTGTLGESRALAGYVAGRSGRELIFSIMVDNHPPGGPADRSIMDRIVSEIAAAN